MTFYRKNVHREHRRRIKSNNIDCFIFGLCLVVFLLIFVAFNYNIDYTDSDQQKQYNNHNQNNNNNHQSKDIPLDGHSSHTKSGVSSHSWWGSKKKFDDVDFLNDKLPNPRYVSKELITDKTSIIHEYDVESGEQVHICLTSKQIERDPFHRKTPPNSRIPNVLWVIFGQFLDHDIGISVNDKTKEPMRVLIEDFLPNIYFNVSKLLRDPLTGNPINGVTPLVDGSHIYGQDEERNHILRSGFEGKMKVNDDDGYPPLNTLGIENEPSHRDPNFYLCGDTRCNENLLLFSFHKLFIDEHNYWAEYYCRQYPHYNDEELYQLARRRVIYTLQYITYEQFLPVLLGKDWYEDIPHYDEYGGDDYPFKMLEEFRSSAYRFGHSGIPNVIEIRDRQYPSSKLACKSLEDIFFPTKHFYEREGKKNIIDNAITGMIMKEIAPIDIKITPQLSNHTMKMHHTGKTQLIFDLPLFNIVRSRTNIISYNGMRNMAGLGPCESWSDITSNEHLINELGNMYGYHWGHKDVDPWIALMAEDPSCDNLYGSLLGPTASHLIKKQFSYIKRADPHFYTWDKAALHLKSQIHADNGICGVLKRNTKISKEFIDSLCLIQNNSDDKLKIFLTEKHW